MVLTKRLLMVLALVFALLLMATMAMPVAQANPGTSVSIEDALGVAVGGTAHVNIEISTDAGNGIGSALITLTVDTAVVSVANVATGALGAVYSNTVGGVTTMLWVTGSSPGPIGSDMLFATVTLQAVGSASECSALDIAVTSMYDGTVDNPQPIVPSPVDDGQFCIAEAAPTPTPITEVACVETVNPHRNNVPGKNRSDNAKSKAQNPDGFYELTATSTCDPDLQIWVVDTGSGMEFGPFASGTNIKYTEAPCGKPSMKKIGSANGQAGAIAVHITGTGDACVYAVDAAGTQSECVDCLVPPPPK